MRGVFRAALLLSCAALLVAPTLGASAAPAPLAHSAQVSVEGARTPAGLALRVVPTPPGTALAVSGVSVSVEGKNVAATREADGSWLAPLAAASTGQPLEITVDHDGIREVLSAASVPAAGPAAPASGGGLLGDHKQLAWWILNIAIVLIAALAISRRRSS